MPTTAIPDAAKLAVVSISTVSRMYNGRNRVHPRTRPRIQKAIRQLDYEQMAPAHTLVEHLLSGHDYRRFACIPDAATQAAYRHMYPPTGGVKYYPTGRCHREALDV